MELTMRKRAVMAQNGLMFVWRALCPIRLKNFASLTIDKYFKFVGERWWIVLSAKESKESRADERPVPRLLSAPPDRRQQTHRPFLFAKADGERIEFGPNIAGTNSLPIKGPFWAGSNSGNGMSYPSIESVIKATTRETVGVQLGPRVFRACAV